MLPEDSRKYRIVGLLATVLYFALIAAYVLIDWSQLLNLKPNEFGDFVAGILGPLAIFWLVLGFWQQGDELRSSVHALNLQSEELRNSVEQQKALVEVTRNQAQAELEALKEERQARKLAMSPRISVRSHGGMSAGGNVTSKFAVYNIGADCLELKVNIAGQGVDSSYEFPMLKHGDSQKFDFHQGQRERAPLQITAVYRMIDGSYGNCEFLATPQRSNRFGFVVEEHVPS